MTGPGLSHRSAAMLRAVAAGRALLSYSSEPDIYVDGLPCCDQMAAREIVHAGLVRPAESGTLGQLVPAEVTEAGRAALAADDLRRAAYAAN